MLFRSNTRFAQFEFILNSICTVAFASLIILIVPFVTLYTKGVNDINYIRYVFAIVACLAELFYCLRLAYTFMVQAKGAFRETRNQYYIEAGLNIVISVALVNVLGLVGIVIGTLVAMVYRTVTFAFFTYRHILKRNFINFIKRMAVTLASIGVSSTAGYLIIRQFSIPSYWNWALYAVGAVILSTVCCAMFSLIFYRKLSVSSVKMLTGRFRR